MVYDARPHKRRGSAFRAAPGKQRTTSRDNSEGVGPVRVAQLKAMHTKETLTAYLTRRMAERQPDDQ